VYMQARPVKIAMPKNIMIQHGQRVCIEPNEC
jgi:hypothetical protein